MTTSESLQSLPTTAKDASLNTADCSIVLGVKNMQSAVFREASFAVVGSDCKDSEVVTVLEINIC